MRQDFVLQYFALSGLAFVVTSAATLDTRQDNDAQAQQLQQQQQQKLQQEQQRNSASMSSISSSFSSQLNSLSTSASSSIFQLQTSLQSAQEAVNTLQRSLGSASRSVDSASQSAASVIAAVQSSASSAEAALSLALQSSMLVSVSSASEVMSISMSSAMVAAIASASASVSAAVFAAQAVPSAAAQTVNSPIATETASMSTVNGAASPAWRDPQSFTGRPSLSRQGGNALGACSTPEVVLAFAGIILGAVGVASLGCILFLWCWRRRQERRRDSDAYEANEDRDAKVSGLSGETRSGKISRQWRIRASATQPKIYNAGVAFGPEMPSNRTSKSSDEIIKHIESAVAATPESTALSTNNRVHSTWSFSTAGGRDNTASQQVAPLSIWGKQQKPAKMSSNFGRGSQATGLQKTQIPPQTQGRTKTRPASSVYEPFSQTARAVLRGVGITYNSDSGNSKLSGLDRISRMEEEWNRSQQQRVAAASAKRGPTYTSNYAFYANNNDNTKATTSRHVSQGSADSLAREYHAFVSELAPVSQYGTTLERKNVDVPQLPRNGTPRPNIGGFEIRPFDTSGLI